MIFSSSFLKAGYRILHGMLEPLEVLLVLVADRPQRNSSMEHSAFLSSTVVTCHRLGHRLSLLSFIDQSTHEFHGSTVMSPVCTPYCN